MIIQSAKFVMSNTRLDKCPKPNKPEYAFIGRSNVGKSSLINMLTGRKSLAKISGKPGKTQLINHFIINEKWYLVDLPGYGYAKVGKEKRSSWMQFTIEYVTKRENLQCLFILIDARIDPQTIDLEFIDQMGQNQIPFNLIFTKTDKMSASQIQKNISKFREALAETWEELPDYFVSSARTGRGGDEILSFISKTNSDF
ncbi:MAG: YihA family ribosome biogenesis GTP-binding protein [Bacteroidetes bacterium]|jgi:GTP-binding protein|nr:YihA family ribosome biogenesis GTP-binding protein [Bacteroidota bacterium]MBT3750932.1 YihA family ribosome biogenesis GTP-binding protein [Bacteroidota bacterium]MBT4399453.1 YihA family ribosome biogenesis GTP-binding protein [Bacteroidota bacterium]MBT4410007.1 YihA family ribosome biogenesis GTP-binding protein [Bacteroidota bacterium]MBT5425932.1 YihA family ribosome biogenesis GTP-binding protein [Bacteroidota bacterium]